jgi:hypothetical protein
MPSTHIFLTIIDKLGLHQEVRDDAISYLREEIPRKFPGIKTIPTTETKKKSIIHSVRAKNSSGYDGITSLCIPNYSTINLHL